MSDSIPITQDITPKLRKALAFDPLSRKPFSADDTYDSGATAENTRLQNIVTPVLGQTYLSMARTIDNLSLAQDINSMRDALRGELKEAMAQISNLIYPIKKS